MTERRLDGQRALLTGAAGGIGRGIAAELASAGARVLLIDRNAAALAETAGAIGDAEAAVCDLTDETAVAALFEGVAGRIDLLVNAAGMIDSGNLADTPPATWRQVFDVNVHAVMQATQLVARRMREQKLHSATRRRGAVVNLGAPVFETVPLNAAAYTTSKAALRYLTALSARELGPDLIACSLLYPGTVVEGMWGRRPRELAERLGVSPDEVLRGWLDRLPAGEPQAPEAVGRMVVYLAASPGMEQNGRVVWGAPYSVSL